MLKRTFSTSSISRLTREVQIRLIYLGLFFVFQCYVGWWYSNPWRPQGPFSGETDIELGSFLLWLALILFRGEIIRRMNRLQLAVQLDLTSIQEREHRPAESRPSCFGQSQLNWRPSPC